MYTSPSYKHCYCGAECDYKDGSTEEQPCWGEVNAIDEITGEDDWWWIHACEGHKDIDYGTSYIKEPKE